VTTIDSLDALDALPEGAQIRLRSVARGTTLWTKNDNGGWVSNTGTVSSTLLVGYAVEGRITRYDNTPLGPGDWFMYRRYLYHLTHVTPEGLLHGYRFSADGAVIGEDSYTTDAFRQDLIDRVDNPPPYVLGNRQTMQTLLYQYESLVATLSAQVATLREQIAAKPQPEKAAPPEVVVTIDGQTMFRYPPEQDDEDGPTVVFGAM